MERKNHDASVEVKIRRSVIEEEGDEPTSKKKTSSGRKFAPKKRIANNTRHMQKTRSESTLHP